MGELRSLRGVISSDSLVGGRLVLFTATILTLHPSSRPNATGCFSNALYYPSTGTSTTVTARHYLGMPTTVYLSFESLATTFPTISSLHPLPYPYDTVFLASDVLPTRIAYYDETLCPAMLALSFDTSSCVVPPFSRLTLEAYLYSHKKGLIRFANVSSTLPRAKLPSRAAPSALAPKTFALVAE